MGDYFIVSFAKFWVIHFLYLLGYLWSEWINIAPGSAVVLVSAVQFMVVFLVAPHYGLLADWLRRRRAVPQPLVEDVLGSIQRAPGSRVPVATVMSHVAGRAEAIRRAIRTLERDGFLEATDDHLTLTEAGEREARRLLRAHRLWEAYLAQVGTPAERLHDQAHVLEHVHDEATVDYLDDKLGHPLHDPHGAEIPEDFVHLVPGADVNAALLREGHSATVLKVSPLAAQTPLRPGMRIRAGARQEDHNLWTFILPDGQEIALDHHAADAVQVRLEGP